MITHFLGEQMLIFLKIFLKSYIRYDKDTIGQMTNSLPLLHYYSS